MMLFLPDADYETDLWGGVSSPESTEIEFGSSEGTVLCIVEGPEVNPASYRDESVAESQLLRRPLRLLRGNC